MLDNILGKNTTKNGCLIGTYCCVQCAIRQHVSSTFNTKNGTSTEKVTLSLEMLFLGL